MAIDLNGSTGISLDDNEKINLGSSNDLQIYHNGGDSIIADTGTGDLYIRGSNDIRLQSATGSDTYAHFQESGYVKLYHNNSEKLATTSTGVQVTGTVAATAYTGDGSALTGVGSPSIDDNGNATAITIDSSENVMVGKAVTNLGTAGITLGESGFGSFTRSGYEPLNVNRLSSDGAIAKFYKDGAEIGSIGTKSGDLVIHSSTTNHVGLMFGNTRIEPTNNYGTTSNNTVDLGNTDRRFKDLYLAGGVYLGGIDAAHKLEDYEEGTWTPTSPTVTFSSVSGTYTKIGNVVHLHATLIVPSTSSSVVFYIDGVPFNQSNVNAAAGLYLRFTTDSTYRMFYLSNGSRITAYDLGGGAVPLADASGSRYDISGIYYTDS
jgi:hypothetical protein